MMVADLLHVAVFADRGEEIGGFQKLIFGNAGDALDHLRRVARVLLLQKLKDATRMLQRQVVGDVRRQHRRRIGPPPVPFAPAGPWRLITAGLPVRMPAASARLSSMRRCVRLRSRCRHALAVSRRPPRSSRWICRRLCVLVEAGEQAVLGQLESVLHDERGVRVVDEVVVRDAVILDRVVDQAAEEGDVGAGANLQEEIGVARPCA